MWNNNEEEREVMEEEEEVWLKHYSSLHNILLVGEGDFSFSLALSNAFGSAHNIVATSLDSYVELMGKYSKAKSNLKLLSEAGATLLHGVDATKMKSHTDLIMRKFDRIVFNFPHAGFFGKEGELSLINKHCSLLREFFSNASCMLHPSGEVHVSHKVDEPYRSWDLEGLASKKGLVVFEYADFRIDDYPGYANKRGQGSKSDNSFRLGDCCTYKFRISETPTWEMRKELPSIQPAFQGINYYSHCNGKYNTPFMVNKLPCVPAPATFLVNSEVKMNYNNVYSRCNDKVNTPFSAGLARRRSSKSFSYSGGTRPCGVWDYTGSYRSGYELRRQYGKAAKCDDEQLIQEKVHCRELISLYGKP